MSWGCWVSGVGEVGVEGGVGGEVGYERGSRIKQCTFCCSGLFSVSVAAVCLTAVLLLSHVLLPQGVCGSSNRPALVCYILN